MKFAAGLVALLAVSALFMMAAAAGGPLVSRDLPAYGAHAQSPTTFINDALYSQDFFCTVPCYAAIDLSTVTLGQSLVSWYNVNNGWDHRLSGDPGYNLPSSYTVDANAAPGGVLPATGWVTLASATAQHYGGRQYVIDLTGYRWLRMNVTASIGGDPAFNLDVMDMSVAGNDSWLIAGDSITSDGMTQDETYQGTQAASPNFMTQINAARPTRFPSELDGGVGGISATVAAGTYQPSGAKGGGHDYMRDWLAVVPAHYVTLNYGTNDVGVPVTDYHDAMNTLVQDVLNAGRVPIVPTIPWRCNADVTPYNAQIANLYAAYPQVVRGPDLYSFFNTHRSLISSDCIHPSYPTGMNVYRQQWAQWAIANVYSGGATPTPTPTATATPTSPPTATPTSTPAPDPTPVTISDVPCSVTLNGVQQTGTCSGTFTRR